jgi:probable HAF family extracellular repeat protein
MKNKVCLGVVAFATAMGGVAKASVTIVALEPVYGDKSWAWAINERGQIVGSSGNDQGWPGDDAVATIWPFDGSGQSIALPNLVYSNGYDVNERGDIVGESSMDGTSTLPCIWSNGEFTLLDDFGRVFAINDNGYAVGDDGEFPMLWINGSSIALDMRSGTARGINSSNAVTGSVRIAPNHWEAFVWQDGVLTTLGTGGATSSRGFAINDAGVLVGNLTQEVNHREAFVYANGRMTPMGTFGHDVSIFWAINNLNQIICYVWNIDEFKLPPEVDLKSAIFANGHFTTLIDLLPANSGWTELEPYDINDQTQIVGYGFWNGIRRGFVMSIHAGDVDGDTIANIDDLLAVIHSWGDCPATDQACPADLAPLGGDGVVNIDDLLQVINNWD